MTLKFVISFVIVTISIVAALPLQLNVKEHDIDNAINELEISTYRLPNNTMPIVYDLKIETLIHTGVLSFNGEINILIYIQETSNTITLHARQLLILDILLRNLDGSTFDSNFRYTYDSATDFLTIITNRELPGSYLFYLNITYVGFLNQPNQRGFFGNSYVDTDTNQTHWFATTSFQPVLARQAFPCYDELQYRAPFELQIVHHRSYNAISNMDVDRIDVIDEEFQATVFWSTPPIPPYVLAFTISNFDFIQNNDTSIDFRVYGRPSVIASGQADNALELGVTFLRAMEDYFGFYYSLPKSDQLAIPQFGSDASWGHIIIGEPFILQTSYDLVAQHNREIRIAHEYSHIFFGNLISPISWSYLWLNEGIATLYENILNDIVFPWKGQWEQFLIDYFDVTISVDISDFVPALNQYVESPQDIEGKYNFLTYYKTALVLRTFHEAFTEPTFRKGLQYFISSSAYSAVTPEDLYYGVQRSYDEDFPGQNVNVAELMRPWFDFNGFPVVTVNRTATGLVVTQQGFGTSHNQSFGIPINYATASYPSADNTAADFWLTGQELFIPRDTAPKLWTDDDWIIFNLRDTYYYITNYDDTLWGLITEALLHDHERIHFLNRGTIFADLERFLTNNYNIRVTLYFELIESLPLEYHHHVWMRANAGLLKVEQRLRGSELHSLYLDFLRNILGEVYRQTTFEDVRADNVVNRWACLAGYESCLSDSLNLLQEVIDFGSTAAEIDFRCNGFLTANPIVWAYFYYNARDQSPSNARLNDLTSLLCSNNRELIRLLLDDALYSSNNFVQNERNAIILAAATQSEISYDTTIEFIDERHEAILEQSLDIVAFISALSSVTNTDSQAERVLNLHRHIPDSFNVPIENFVEIMEPNRQFYTRNSEGVRSWLQSRREANTHV